ncbi:xylitol oxidase [Microterricola gilva]|uniref:Xylitol oxidase n=1 Tax=Microterricola gilva TaxID=393267 RepID=A0A4Q8AQ73_9MICO|nr:D-arabinono-1,4-lactone oxidase [Microterricola gilva]RZU66351.1 xylitol oxidase [Microterricola gilva]
MGTGQNWAGNLRYSATTVHEPREAAEVQRLVADAAAGGVGVRALGSRHSFNDIADSDGVLISTRLLAGEISCDAEADAGRAGTVAVGAGIRYGELALALQERGLAVANLASLPHISVGGAVATGTHGSGDAVGSLATAVRGIELVDGTGAVRVLRDGDADFAGAVVSLGALGIVTRVTLAVEPAFTVAQTVYEGLSWSALLADVGAITGAGYSVSVFTRWNDDGPDQVWVKRRESAPGEEADAVLAAGAVAAPEPRHPLPGISAESCTEQLGVPGPWFERLPHFRLAFTPSNGAELQSEYLIPRQHAAEAITALRALGDRIRPLLQICELRTVAADELWLSSAYQRDTLGIHFTWLQHQSEVEALLPVIEATLAPFSARPHWGKLFTQTTAAIAPLYPRHADFVALVAAYDPHGVFRNDYLRRVLL